MMPDWYFNTSNDSKIREVRHFFRGASKLGILRHPVVEILETELEMLDKLGEQLYLQRFAPPRGD